MKTNKILLILASGALLAGCGRVVLTPEEASSYKQAQSTPSTSAPATSTPASTPGSEPGSDPTSDPTSASTGGDTSTGEDFSTGGDVSTGGDTSTGDDTSAGGDTSTGEEPSSGTGETEYLYFRESTWWNAKTVVNFVTVDDAGITGVDPAFSFDFEDMIELEYVSTVQTTATDYFNYYRVDLAQLDGARTIRFIRAGYEVIDKVPTENILSYGAWTTVIELSGRGDHDMYDLLGVGEPEGWSVEGGSRAVTGVWGTYDPESDIPYDPSTDVSGWHVYVNGTGVEAENEAPEGGKDLAIFNLALNAEDEININYDGSPLLFYGLDGKEFAEATEVYTAPEDANYIFYVNTQKQIWVVKRAPSEGEVTVNMYVAMNISAEEAKLTAYAWIWTNDTDGAWYLATHVGDSWEEDDNRHYVATVEDPVGKNILLAIFKADSGVTAASAPANWDGVLKQSADATILDWGNAVGCNLSLA